MKEAIGGTSLFVIVIVILSVFALYISVSVNWSNAYKVKDEIVFYIEKNNGMNDKTIRDISNYLTDVAGYFNTGACPTEDGWDGYTIVQVGNRVGPSSSTAANYCVAKVNFLKNDESGMGTGTKGIDKAYYSVRTFFLLDLPIIRNMGITIDGETKLVINPKDHSGKRSVDVDKHNRQRSWG